MTAGQQPARHPHGDRGEDSDADRSPVPRKPPRAARSRAARSPVTPEEAPLPHVENPSEARSPTGSTGGPVQMRLPGRPRPAQDALDEYNDHNARRRIGIPSVLWVFFAPNPDTMHRWRIKLDCGCITEVLTHGEDHAPAGRQWLDYRSRALPTDQFLCRHDDAPPPPYRQITEWTTRRTITFPADPVDPPDWADKQTWATRRHDQPFTRASWTVTLSCGHSTDVLTDPAWKPADGPHRVTTKRQREMTAEFEEYWASYPDEQNERDREHLRRLLAAGWPRPDPEQLCYLCPAARTIVAYQRVGPLVGPDPAPRPRRPPSRETMRRTLRMFESEAQRLRDRLAELDAEEQTGADGDR